MPKLPEGEKPKKKTSISLDETVLKAAKVRFRKLGYRSFSDYLEKLIKRDLSEGGPHIITLEERPNITPLAAEEESPYKSSK